MTRLLATRVAPNVERKIRRGCREKRSLTPGLPAVLVRWNLERLAYAQIRDAAASLGACIARVCSKQLWRDFRHGYRRAASPHRGSRGAVDGHKYGLHPACHHQSA